MKANCFFLLILLFCFLEQTTAQQYVCPPWFIPDNTSVTGCSCHEYDAKVYCGPDFPLLRYGFCMTYNSTTGATVQKVCLMLWISKVACSAHVCGIISGTVQGWNQWYSRLQDGFCIVCHPQDTDTVLVPKSPSVTHTHI